MNAAQTQRRLCRLWRMRRDALLHRLRWELMMCDDVMAGGTAASRVNQGLGTLGYVHYKRSNPWATVQEWRAWEKEVKQLAKERAVLLQKRLARVEAMAEPVPPSGAG